MKAGLRTIIVAAAFCALTLIGAPPAQAQIPSKTEVDVGLAAAIGVAAAIGIGIYFVVHNSNHNLTGCAVSGAGGMQLQREGDPQAYALIGDVAGIKPGERVRVSGKKQKRGAGATRQFLVEKLSKDYGACKAHPATP